MNFYLILWSEDYARSIIQPGSSQDTSMTRTLVLLNNVAIPHAGPGIDEQQRTDVMYKLSQTLNAKVCSCEFGCPSIIDMLVYKDLVNWGQPRIS